MPIYEYECKKCKARRSELLRRDELETTTVFCNYCMNKKMERVIAPANFVWKTGSPTPKFHH